MATWKVVLGRLAPAIALVLAACAAPPSGDQGRVLGEAKAWREEEP